ncbi:MAG: class I SAM-dependent methyltransferase [Salibacteraceae bacterium]
MAAKRLKLGFNLLGNIYNPLKKYFLKNQPENAIAIGVSRLKRLYTKILIVGGGADNTIEELLKLESVIEITQVDISETLTNKSKKRIQSGVKPKHNVCYEVNAFLDWQSLKKFDLIICPFYLDLFGDEEILKNLEKMKSMLNPEGEILVIDFKSFANQSIRQQWQLRILYLLFYPFTGIIRKATPDYLTLFDKKKYKLRSEIPLALPSYSALLFGLKRN